MPSIISKIIYTLTDEAPRLATYSLLPIVRGMRETKVAAIVAEMDPAKARALTVELARAGGNPGTP